MIAELIQAVRSSRAEKDAKSESEKQIAELRELMTAMPEADRNILIAALQEKADEAAPVAETPEKPANEPEAKGNGTEGQEKATPAPTPAAQAAPPVPAGTARPIAGGQSAVSLESMTPSQINAMWDKGDIHRMYNQTPPEQG